MDSNLRVGLSLPTQTTSFLSTSGQCYDLNRRVVFLYLESREIVSNLEQDALERWCLAELKKIFDGKSPESAVRSAEFAKFMAELHYRLKNKTLR